MSHKVFCLPTLVEFTDGRKQNFRAVSDGLAEISYTDLTKNTDTITLDLDHKQFKYQNINASVHDDCNVVQNPTFTNTGYN